MPENLKNYTDTINSNKQIISLISCHAAEVDKWSLDYHFYCAMHCMQTLSGTGYRSR